MKQEHITFGKLRQYACDEKCNKAWGINARPSIQLSEDDDDFAYLSDEELGEAPADPGTYEGGHGKPPSIEWAMNRWCARECERCVKGEPGEDLVLPDFSKRSYNLTDRDEAV